MPIESPFDIEGPRPSAAGTGLIALDLVIPTEPLSVPQLWAGGTCGNVLTALTYLGWEAYPLARFRDDAASRQIIQDLTRWDVRLDFLKLDDSGSTPVIVQHIRCTPNRESTHTFSRRCPYCGTMLPWYKPIRVADAAQILPRLPQVETFFFDRISPGVILLAKHAARRGALIVFEPSSSNDPRRLLEALSISHIVKYSLDRLEGLAEMCEGRGPSLIIETQGRAGLRFLWRLDGARGTWQTSESLPAPKVVDTAGCGDWCTAGVIHMLGQHGAEGFLQITPARLREALRFGQALAAWNCGFEGARGGMYRSDKAHFRQFVLRLLAGESSQPDELDANPTPWTLRGEYSCAACGGRPIDLR